MSASIGLRAAPKSLSFAVVEFGEDSATLVALKTLKIPGGEWARCLVWARREVQGLITTHHVECGGFRATEPVVRKPARERTELEGVIQEASAALDPPLSLQRYVGRSLASRLGFKNAAKPPDDALATLGFPGITKLEEVEALLVALAGRHA